MKTEQPYLNRLLLYFFRGLLLVAPLGATLYLISMVLQKIDGLASFGIPGLGMFIVASSITLLGYIGSTLLVQSAFGFTEALIKKLPFVSMLYTSLKDITSAFVSSERKFDKPVIVLVDKTTEVYRIGFLTKESLEMLSMPGHVAVYLPNSYDFSGTLLLMPPELVRPLDLPSSEVMKFIVSGAVTPLKTTSTAEEVMDLDGVE
jgi:uncharacterized membrane protein